MTLPTYSRVTRLLVVLLGASLAAAAAPRPYLAAAPTEAVVVNSDGRRVAVESPFIHLELDLTRPALDVLRVAPAGDGQYGRSVGSVVEEASVGGHHLRSSSDDPDGARASWLNTPYGVALSVEGIDLGGSITVTWVVTVPANSPTLRVDRLVNFHGDPTAESAGLAVIAPLDPEGVDPSTIAHVLNGATYRLEVGPASLEQPGGTLGVLAVDNPELTFSARTDLPDRVVGRQDGSNLTLAFLRHLSPPRQNGQYQEAVAFRFGWNNDFVAAHSDVAPNVESRLLASGYYGNAVISPSFGPVLSASMRDYRGSVWSRDSDYAMQGYSYVLYDMSVFRNNLQKFLDLVDNSGVAPEYILLDGRYGNRQSWDSMANVVQAMYTYVSKSGELDFYRRNEGSVKKAANWIRALDTNGDGLPDRDIFNFGYTDTVENGPMHTYAIAKFYAAFQALAELDEAIGKDASSWRSYARLMQGNFGQPLSAGGYWNPEAGYPIAWKRANGQVFSSFETFGVFEAIRVGLLNNADQLQAIALWSDGNRGVFMNSNSYPERLMIGGYDLQVKKPEVPQDKLWIMDCNAPWITGLSVPARVRLGRVADARAMLDAYSTSSNRSTPHAEFGAGPAGRYGPGETGDGGRLWDNWSWFSAVYGTHFGLKMTPTALEIAPAPLDPVVGRRLFGVTYQGAQVEMELMDSGYQVSLDASKQLVLRPPYGFSAIDVNGDGDVRSTRVINAAAGVPYVIQAYR